MATDVERAGLTEGLKKTVEEDLRLSFFVASNVLLTPRGKFGEFFPVRHGGVLQEACRVSNPKLREPAQAGACVKTPRIEKPSLTFSI